MNVLYLPKMPENTVKDGWNVYLGHDKYTYMYKKHDPKAPPWLIDMKYQFWSSSVLNFMLVRNSARYKLKNPLRLGL